MPIYDFQCSICSHIFEELCAASVKHMSCPKCEAPSERQVSCIKETGVIGHARWKIMNAANNPPTEKVSVSVKK